MFKYRSVNFHTPTLFKTYLAKDEDCKINLTANNGLEMSNLFKIINLQSLLMVDATPVIQEARKLPKDRINQALLETVNPLYINIKEIHYYPLKYIVEIGYTIDQNWIFFIQHNLNGMRIDKPVLVEEQK